ncbi:MAG TPA: type II secretion system protein GspG [Thermoanaerobaculia bacterium]|nr:type II secretion system protein GspG [Thermoanaerobaculia bacterium]
MSYCAHCGGQVPDGAAFCPSCGKPPAGPVVTAEKSSSKALYVVVGCVIVLILIFVLGIVAAIVIPNYLNALQRAKEKTALAEVQTMGQAIELYKAEHGYAPPATDMAGLAAALGPGYSSSIQRLDPWQHPFRYACWQESPTAKGCDHYRIACAGRDGKFEQVAPSDYDRDIVWADGAFIAQPRGR